MKVTEIAFTGTPVTDMKRSRAFYEGILGFKPTMDSAGGMWVEYEFGNGTLGLGCYGDVWKPSPDGTCIAFEVEDVDAEFANLKAKGVTIDLEPMNSPICRFGMIRDPDGNRILIHKRNATTTPSRQS